MYGTIAKLRVRQGKEAELMKTFEGEEEDTPGFVSAHVYRMDDDPQTLMLAVAFDSRESYHRNAQSPEQHQEYLRYRELLEEEPEWHDGEIIHSTVRGSGTYGTIARLRIKDGVEVELEAISRRHENEIADLAFEHVYRLDADPKDLMLVVGFTDRNAYRANAESPEQNQRYLELRKLMEADPEWHDGEVIHSITADAAVAGT